MDLVRLGLERGRTAREALEVIVKLLETHGQFGSGAPTAGIEGAYDNSFLIADAREAWILETAGTRWAARRIDRGTASISNALGIAGKWDRSSRDLADDAVWSGWWPKERAGELDFAAAYSDDSPEGTARRERAMTRAACSSRLLAERAGEIDPPYMMRVARDRSTDPSIDLDITASSCVAVVGKGRGAVPVFWWCPAVPSSGCYVPFFVEAGGLPDAVSRAGTHGKRVVDPSIAARDSFSADSYWWIFRDLCDAVNLSWDARQPVARAAFDSLEASFAAELPGVVAEAARLRRSGAADEASDVLGGFSARCAERALDKAKGLRARFAAEAPAASASARFAPYIGLYTADFGSLAGKELKVFERGGRLAVDIPGQMAVDLNEPDEEGVRTLVLTDRVAFSFAVDGAGAATALRLHQATILTRAPGDSVPSPDAVEERYRPFVGLYVLPIADLSVSLRVSGGKLALDTPDESGIPVEDPDEKGRWRFSEDPATFLTFDGNASGAVSAVRINQTFVMPRK
jgi:secernin